jgi:hypothetical protein
LLFADLVDQPLGVGPDPSRSMEERVDAPAGPEDDAAGSGEVEPKRESLRPKAVLVGDQTSAIRRKRIVISFAAVFLAMSGMAIVAIANREDPQSYQAAPKVERVETADDLGKTENRLAAGAEAPPAPSSGSRLPPRSAPATAGAGAPLAVSQRAFMVQEPTSSGAPPPQFEGRVIWSFSGGANGSLRARVEFNTANLNLDLTMIRNKEAALKASHTILVTFEPLAGGDSVREISAIEWRERESQPGGSMIGLMVPVQQNSFMIGLDDTNFARNRNMELLRSQKWMVFELRFTNGRRAAILIEKGNEGDKAINEAFLAWK